LRFNALHVTKVRALLRLPHYKKGSLECDNVILLAKERRGTCKNQFNLPGGKLKKNHMYCPITEIIARLKQEIKMDLNMKDFMKMFARKRAVSFIGSLRFFIIDNSIIFIGKLPKGTSRASFNKLITKDNSRSHIPKYMQEIECVDYFCYCPYSRCVTGLEDNEHTRKYKVTDLTIKAIINAFYYNFY
jgi:hypothetical protein